MFLEGLSIVMSLENFVFMVLGTLAGLVFAVIPGLTFSTAMVLFVPITFGLQPISAVALLMGVFAGGMSGGAFSAILLGIPGTPSAAATVLDGHPMALRGEGNKACGVAAFSSVFGGLFSLIVLMLIAPQIAKVALKFGPPVIFALTLFGFSTVIALSGKEIVKGVLTGALGLLICCIGVDPVVGIPRFTFGNVSLLGGVSVMPILIGMFAVPEIINTFVEGKRAGGFLERQMTFTKGEKVAAPFPSFKEMRRLLPTLFTSSIMGTILGCIPGTAGPIAPFLAYDQCKRKYADCGTGIIEGVAAPEAANNAVQGGAMIPMMTLGIPLDSSTAIIMSALVIHGLAPGPLLFQNNGGFVYAIFISLFIIYLMALVLQFWGIRIFIRVLSVPRLQLMASILILAFVGSYAITLNFINIVVMFIAGFMAYFMKLYGYPSMPLILGVVLGGPMETNLRSSLSLSNMDPMILFENPVSIVLYLLALVVLCLPFIQTRRGKKQGGSTASEDS